jgi:hypothetical protein
MLYIQGWLPQFQWDFNDGFDLGAAQKNCDFCKKAFYGSLFVVAPAAACAALFFLRKRRTGTIALSVFTIALVFAAIHYANDERRFAPSFVLLLIAVASRLLTGYRPTIPDEEVARPAFRVGWPDLMAVLFLIALLATSSLEAVTAGPLNEAHKASYFIGPSLYFYAQGLVPGLDYHSHYGPALGWFFHQIAGSGWKSAAMNAVALNIAVTIATYVQGYLLLSYLVRSRAVSLFVMAALAILAFSTPNHFYSPSAYPTRFPLLILFVCTLGMYCRSPQFSVWFYLSALMCALSLMWQTEIGLFFLVCGAFICLVASGFPNYRAAFWFVFSALLGAAALCLILFGPKALTVTFLVESIKPMVLYGTGWGSMPIKWGSTGDILYNLPLQIVGCVTIAWTSNALIKGEKTDRFVAGVLLALSLIGMALMIKWVNRTLDAVWHQNALPLVIVAAYWIAVSMQGWRRVIRIAAVLSAMTLTILGLVYVQDQGNPTLYGFRSYVRYPSLINASLGVTPPKQPQWQDDFARVTPTETNFIRANTAPGERVLVIAFVDWAYLAEAHRAPLAYFIPLTVSFDAHFVDRTFAGASKLFYDAATLKYLRQPRTKDILDRIKADFVEVETAGNLTLYKRR